MCHLVTLGRGVGTLIIDTNKDCIDTREISRSSKENYDKILTKTCFSNKTLADNNTTQYSNFNFISAFFCICYNWYMLILDTSFYSVYLTAKSHLFGLRTDYEYVDTLCYNQ